MGRKRHRKTRQRHAESFTAGLHVRFLLRPAAEESLSVEVTRQVVQMLNFPRGEEATRDFGVIRLRADILDIDADVGVRCDGYQGEIRGMGEVEFEPSAESRAQRGLSVLVVRESDCRGVGPKIAASQ